MADLYERLGLSKGASTADIKKAYRKLAKELHPDRNKDNPKASERFSEVTAAYDLLSDDAKRARYDRGEIDDNGNPAAPFGFAGAAGARPGGGFHPGAGAGGFRAQGPGGMQFEFEPEGGDFGDLGDLFGSFFGGRRGQGAARRGPARGADVAYRLTVPFEDAAALKPQRITLSGGGTVDLKLPAGFESGTQVRLAGKGQQGAGGPGDAIVTLEIGTHRFFHRDGDDVRLDLPVRLDEAVLGAKIKVPTVEGAVMLSIPPNSSSGKTLRLKGRGFHKSGGGGRGDQLVTLMLDVPADDQELAEFAAKWRGGGRNPRAGLGV
jgi:DnaJ-class molecular chaperone